MSLRKVRTIEEMVKLAKHKKSKLEFVAVQYAGTTTETKEVYNWLQTTNPQGVGFDVESGDIILSNDLGEQKVPYGDWIVIGGDGQMFAATSLWFNETFDIVGETNKEGNA